MNHGHLLIHQRRFDRPKMGHVCVASHSTSDSETGSPLECTSLALCGFRTYVQNLIHNSRGFYSTHRSTTRDQYAAHEGSDASVGMKAHEEPRTDLVSHEAVCLQARSVWPLATLMVQSCMEPCPKPHSQHGAPAEVQWLHLPAHA